MSGELKGLKIVGGDDSAVCGPDGCVLPARTAQSGSSLLSGLADSSEEAQKVEVQNVDQAGNVAGKGDD